MSCELLGSLHWPQCWLGGQGLLGGTGRDGIVHPCPGKQTLRGLAQVTATPSLAPFQLLNNNVVNDLVLLESMMDSMTTRQRDSCTSVRMLAVRGLGNIASGSPDKVRGSVMDSRRG